jgi:multiple sugar transport system substrate-binding protein
MTNGARYNYVLDPWLRQRDKRLFTADGKLGFTEDDAREWYEYWDGLSKAGALVAPDVMAADTNSIDTNALPAGKAAMAFTYSNQLIGYQGVMKQSLEITTLPVSEKGGTLGMWYRPALIWSVGQSSAHPEEAAKFIDFFVNDPDAGLILGVERGVNVNLDVRAKVAPTLDPVAQKTVAYVDFLADKVVPYAFPAPKGYQEFDSQVMRPIADELGFGRISPADAAKRLIEDGTRAITAS